MKNLLVAYFLILISTCSCSPTKLAEVEIRIDHEVQSNLGLFENHEYRIKYAFKYDSEMEFERGSYVVKDELILLNPNSHPDRKDEDPFIYGHLWNEQKIVLNDKTYRIKREFN